jgi:hypothetical protein
MTEKICPECNGEGGARRRSTGPLRSRQALSPRAVLPIRPRVRAGKWQSQRAARQGLQSSIGDALAEFPSSCGECRILARLRPSEMSTLGRLPGAKRTRFAHSELSRC